MYILYTPESVFLRCPTPSASLSLSLTLAHIYLACMRISSVHVSGDNVSPHLAVVLRIRGAKVIAVVALNDGKCRRRRRRGRCLSLLLASAPPHALISLTIAPLSRTILLSLLGSLPWRDTAPFDTAPTLSGPVVTQLTS